MCADIETTNMSKYYVKINNVSEHWFKDSDLCITHRVFSAAVRQYGGRTYWYRDGKLHRGGGPAAIYPNGVTLYYLNGVYYAKDDYEQILRGNQW